MTETTITELLDKAEIKCKALGLKLTSKRRLILEQLLSTKKVMSAYDIVDQLKLNHDKKMPAMSVYRILELLEQCNLVHKLESQNKYVACRHIQCDHLHQSAQFLICQNCSYVREINMENDIVDQINDSTSQDDFKIQNSVIEFKGLCKQCQ